MNSDSSPSMYLGRIAAAALGLALLTAACSDDDTVDAETATTETVDSTPTAAQPSSAVEVATQFWEALSDRDRAATLALADPAAVESPDLAPFGRANTLEGQFDWYESVGWEWELEECSETAEGVVCTAAARNTWSDSLGVGPVTGSFQVEVSDAGVTAVTDQADSFLSQWSPMVFGVFAEWVDANHPDDAATMFDFATDINDEILGLYEVNTSRFVEAQADG